MSKRNKKGKREILYCLLILPGCLRNTFLVWRAWWLITVLYINLVGYYSSLLAEEKEWPIGEERKKDLFLLLHLQPLHQLLHQQSQTRQIRQIDRHSVMQDLKKIYKFKDPHTVWQKRNRIMVHIQSAA